MNVRVLHTRFNQTANTAVVLAETHERYAIATTQISSPSAEHTRRSHATYRLTPVCCRTRRRGSPPPQVKTPQTQWYRHAASNSTLGTSPTRTTQTTVAELRLVLPHLSSFARAGQAGETWPRSFPCSRGPNKCPVLLRQERSGLCAKNALRLDDRTCARCSMYLDVSATGEVRGAHR